MAALGLTTKILSVVIAGVAGSGIVAGSVIAASNNRVSVENIAFEKQSKNPESFDSLESSSDDSSGKVTSHSDKIESSKDSVDGLKDQETVKAVESEKTLPSIPEFTEKTLSSKTLPESKGDETQQQISSSVSSETGTPEKSNFRTKSRKQSRDIEEEKLSIRYKREQEAAKKLIGLESVYIDGVGTGELVTKGCIIYKFGETIKNQTGDENFDITEGRTEEGKKHNSCDELTLWSSNKLDVDDHEGTSFWVRGERGLVNKLLRENWDNLSTSGLISKELDKKTSEGLSKEFCSIEKDDGMWMEISCFKSTKQTLNR
ncbi:hypothetical protein [Mycoplasma suis]|uniref:Uncharacterized protein n=1 Tax=Mycoplasma suis (strain Illinois) TaxID=768700 RepID=F0QQ14_MYCSL|nr:hypothetical protein [Mycoplasma suis]ADX97584.1 hypothetical protein MSU_0040 [Mycoplasma suis str. Illinois]